MPDALHALETIITGSYDGSVRLWKPDMDSTAWKLHVTCSVRDNGEGCESDTTRIFSIQLDERRLFCGSEQCFITGWDFEGR